MDSKEALFRLLVWFLYFNGVGIHILLCAIGSIAAKSNSVVTFRAWWDYNWPTLRIRMLCNSGALIFWELSPRLLGELIGREIPITYITAVVMGITIDRIVGSLGFKFGWGADMGKVAPLQQKEGTS